MVDTVLQEGQERQGEQESLDPGIEAKYQRPFSHWAVQLCFLK
jgi:hypothetical protein